MSRTLRVVCILFLLAMTCAAQSAPQKKRVAVLDFDYGTVRSYVTAIWGSDQDVGKGVADLLVQKLVQDGKYRVIERKQLDKILAEQNFNNSDRADPATASRIGKVLGVDAIIVGSITKFGRDDKNTTVGGGGFGLGKFGVGGVQKRDAKAVCGITARLIDTSTAEILAAVTGNGESKRGGASLVGAGGGGGGAGAGAFDMSSKNFGETILGEAVNQAVNSTGDQLDSAAGNLPTHKAEVNALVADVSGNTLILNVGSRSGLQVGDRLEISRAVRTVKDPATGKILKTVTTKIGDATVTEIDASSTTVNFTGNGPVKVGDVAKTPGGGN
jgi:curli biogenesis system outer membrane secretion channel CsgG